ncbi:MAG: alternate-type signal peptide domain-containing protein [Bifidobacteriaceae bacterium]|jgi:alternate signal-mediated exported protein|nr:alternate-type signal peptide domain-containing protein [Bifidobacteriaceae bacterium]
MKHASRDSRSLRTKGLVAGAAGLALLLGGATFATWSDSGEADPGSVTHGNLDLAAEFDSLTIYDVSSDRVNQADAVATLLHDKTSQDKGGNAIDQANFKAVPGDSIELDLKGIEVTLSGDNMKADLTLSATGSAGNGWTLTYQVFEWQTSNYVAISDDWAHGDLGDLSTPVTVAEDAVDGAKYAVAISGSFDASDQNYVSEALDLGTISVNLTQVRPS